jgi:hypothetical protein
MGSEKKGEGLTRGSAAHVKEDTDPTFEVDREDRLTRKKS